MKISFDIDSRSSYSTAHATKAIVLIGTDVIGRERLMKRLALNEASVRTLLKRLEQNNYVMPGSKGHGLTAKGKKLFAYITKNIEGPKPINDKDVAVSKYNVAYLVRGRRNKIKAGLEQRDQAIPLGADGLITLIYDNGLVMPGIKLRVPQLGGLFSFRNGDVLLIGSAKTEILADLAALNSAVRLL